MVVRRVTSESLTGWFSLMGIDGRMGSALRVSTPISMRRKRCTNSVLHEHTIRDYPRSCSIKENTSMEKQGGGLSLWKSMKST